MKNVLVIVEASGKTETLRKALKGIGIEAKVMATIGHIADNPKSLLPIAIDCDLHETAYVLKPERGQLIEKLREAAYSADKVFLAMDDDQEGDVIAWDVAQALTDNMDKLYRVRLRAVSEEELKKAFLGELSQEFREPANNGTCRRIVDRAIGASFSEFGTPPVYAGRVQSSLLAQLDKSAPQIGEFIVQAKVSSGEIFHAHVPVFNLTELPRLEAFQRSVEAGRGRILGEIDTEHPLSSPWGFEEIVAETSERLGIGIEDAAKGFQEAYERGRVSYPRARVNGFTQDAVEVAAQLARQNRCAIDSGLLPRRQIGSSGKVPHESPRPLDDSMSLSRPLSVLDTPEAIAVLIARNMIECGQIVKTKKVTIEADGVEAMFSYTAKPPMKPWREPPIALGFQRSSNESILLRYMAKHDLGRPSTIVNHVVKFLHRDLVSLTGDQPFSLTAKGRRWLAHTKAHGFEANTSFRVEAALEDTVPDPHARAREILKEHDMLERVLETIGSEPVMPEAHAEADFVM